MTKKIAILGGAFNPIHIAHVEIANAILSKLNYDEIWFLVSFNPPHKELVDIEDFNHRCNMVKLAIENDDRFVFKDLEYKIYKEKVFDINSSYNVLSYITNKYPDFDFSLVIGYDELLDIKSWRNYKELLKKYKFIIVRREGYEVNKDIINQLKEDFNFKYELIDVSINPCSSTNIRNEIKKNKYSKFLDKKVLDYILANNLYKEI